MREYRLVLTAAVLSIIAGCGAPRDDSAAPAGTGNPRSSEAQSPSEEEPAPSELPPPAAAPSVGEAPPDFEAGPNAAPSAATPRTGEASEVPGGPATGHESNLEHGKVDDHVVRVFYATDRAPENAAGASVTWRRYLPVFAAVGVMILAGLGVFVVRRKWIALAVTITAFAAAVFLGQSAAVRTQQIRRAAEWGDRTYGNGRHEQQGRPMLELGVCEVTIPPDHRIGRVESPSVLRFEFREDPEKHVILNRIVRLPDDDFYGLLQQSIDETSTRQVFVFIHGYNVGFDSAVKRTAQIAYDLKFDGAAVCYSWPSHAGLARYTQDEANVAWTVTQLEGFLRDVAVRSGARTVHLVAHSMGNRALVQAIERLALRGDGPKFGQVILAAPDIDAGEFRARYASALAQVAGRTTLYASSNDRALLASTRVHGYTRAGLSGEHLVVVPGLDTIDVSPIDTSLIGHSYYGDNPLMIRDLVAVIHLGLPADGREWLRRTIVSPEAFYWAFRQELMPGMP